MALTVFKILNCVYKYPFVYYISVFMYLYSEYQCFRILIEYWPKINKFKSGEHRFFVQPQDFSEPFYDSVHYGYDIIYFLTLIDHGTLFKGISCGTSIQLNAGIRRRG